MLKRTKICIAGLAAVMAILIGIGTMTVPVQATPAPAPIAPRPTVPPPMIPQPTAPPVQAAPVQEPAEEEGQEDQVWLDENTYVLRSQIINRLSQQRVPFAVGNQAGPDLGIRTTRPLYQQATDWEPPTRNGVFMGHVLGRDVLVERAIGYMEGIFNVNYRTMTAEQWVDSWFGYIVNRYASPQDEINWRYQEWIDIFNEQIVPQRLIMNTIFVTDESLVYILPEHESRINNVGESINNTPWAVRGTIFFRFDSIDGDSRDFFWDTGYRVGNWYWFDMEVRFGVDDRAPGNYVALTNPSRTFTLNLDGSRLTTTSRPQPLSMMPRD